MARTTGTCVTSNLDAASELSTSQSFLRDLCGLLVAPGRARSQDGRCTGAA